jgi:hypothetical protein
LRQATDQGGSGAVTAGVNDPGPGVGRFQGQSQLVVGTPVEHCAQCEQLVDPAPGGVGQCAQEPIEPVGSQLVHVTTRSHEEGHLSRCKIDGVSTIIERPDQPSAEQAAAALTYRAVQALRGRFADLEVAVPDGS